MAKRENYNELYLFMQVGGKAVLPLRLRGWGLLNQGSAVPFVSLKKDWASSYWYAPHVSFR